MSVCSLAAFMLRKQICRYVLYFFKGCIKISDFHHLGKANVLEVYSSEA